MNHAEVSIARAFECVLLVAKRGSCVKNLQPQRLYGSHPDGMVAVVSQIVARIGVGEDR